VILWITHATHAINAQIAQSIIYIENVVDLWEDLKDESRQF